MNKFLYFANSVTDAGAIPVSLLREIDVNSTSTLLTFKFKDVGDGIGQDVELAIDITTDKPKEVIDAISNEIRYGKKSLIVIADEINNEFIHSDVISVNGSIDLT